MENEFSSIDRRENMRFELRPPLKASFESAGASLNAFVEDISADGARLRLPYSNQRLPFLLQGEFDYIFRSEHSEQNSSLFRGKTAWVQRVNADFIWGIEFVTV
jgi:hypothetical protein